MTSVNRSIDSWLPFFISHLWSSTIFLLIILLIVFAFRRRLTAGALFSLALIGIVKFAIPAGAVMPAIKLLTGDRLRLDAVLPFDFPLQLLGGSFQLGPPAVNPSPWPIIVAAVWLSIALLLIIRFSLSRHRLVALSLKTAMAPQARETAALARAQHRVGVHNSIDLARSALPEAPAILRVFRPLLVLPASGCDDLTDEELESLLCHECAHVARHDNLIARVESLICALFWFHPLIWIAQRITVIERERACDEVVSGSADERNTYLAALRKFCHAAIAPRMPGVSCMATSKLKERIDHVMDYSTLKAHAPSPKRVTLLATALLFVFTISTGMIGDRAFAGSPKGSPYSIKATATRSGDSIELQGTVRDNKTQQVVAAPRLTLSPSQPATTKSSSPGIDVTFDARASSSGRVDLEVTVESNGDVIQRSTLKVVPTEATAQKREYTGEPINLALSDADIRDVINTFGKLTGLQMRIDDSIQGKVSVSWQNVPWDEAFDSLLSDNGLVYKLEGSTILVTRK